MIWTYRLREHILRDGGRGLRGWCRVRNGLWQGGCWRRGLWLLRERGGGYERVSWWAISVVLVVVVIVRRVLRLVRIEGKESADAVVFKD